MIFEANFVKDGNKLLIDREFNAPVEKVWKAWTTADILDKWWAPKPYVNKTKSHEFKEGGRWLYSMTSPEGDTHWCRADYQTINPMQNFSAIDSFCDENGHTQKPFPNSHWFNEFKLTDTGSKVKITLTFEDEAALEKIVEMGFKEGFTMAMGNLEETLGK